MPGRHHEVTVATAAAHPLEALNDFLSDTGNDPPAHPGFPADELSDRAGRGGATEEAVPLEQQRASTLAGRGDGGDGAGHAATAGKDVTLYRIHGQWDSGTKPIILQAKQEREDRVLQGNIKRRAAIGGIAALAMARPLAAQDLTKASIALLRLSSSGPIFIAQEKGWFREAGLDLTMKDFQAAAQVPLAVVSGDVDLGVTAFTAGFFNLAAKGGLKVVAAQSAERPGYQLNVVAVTNAAWDAGVRSVKDLTGKRVAVTTVGSSVHYSLEMVAKKFGVDTKKLTIVALQTIPNMVAAFKGGQVDAAVFPITTFRQVESEGSGKPIAYVGDEVPWQLGAVFTSPRTIVERRPMVEKFLVGYRRGAAAYHEAFGKRVDGKLIPGPNYDEMIGILSNVLKQPPDRVALGLPFIDPLGRLDVGDIYKQVAFWQSTGQVSRDANPKSFIDLSFIDGHFNVPG